MKFGGFWQSSSLSQFRLEVCVASCATVSYAHRYRPGTLSSRVEHTFRFISQSCAERGQQAEAAEQETIRTVVGNMSISGLRLNKIAR